MAWRIKSLLLFCVLFTVGIIFVQEFFNFVVDDKRGYSNKARKETIWHGKQILTKNVSTSTIKPYRRNHDATTTTGSHQTKYGSDSGSTFSRNEFPNDMTTSFDVTTLSIENEHERRIRMLKDSCRLSAEFRRSESRKASTAEFYYSSRLHFAYCKVPKSGSTFWMNVFLTLNKGDAISQMISNISRYDIHEKSRHMVVDPRKVVLEGIKTVVVSRNPYSRLFSAYVDKLYLPLFWEHFAELEGARLLPHLYFNTTKDFLKTSKGEVIGSGRILRYKEKLRQHGLLITKNVTVKIRPVCANDITFKQFLSFVINQTKNRIPLEAHWAPISHMCHPCRVNTYKVVKQESFAADVEHTLTSVGMNLSEYDWLKRSLNEDRVETSVPGIVAVVARRLLLKQVYLCISHSEVAQRLWKAFQIQGFIHDQSRIPEVFLSPKFRFNKREVSKIILETIKEKPLTLRESARQRERHLREAYANLPADIVQGIQDVYQLDFTLFDYSDLPPS